MKAITPAMYAALNLIRRGQWTGGKRTLTALKRRRLARMTDNGLELTATGARVLAKHIQRNQEQLTSVRSPQ